jgi:pimeloyl-ACP methyl ester carboxylesterase
MKATFLFATLFLASAIATPQESSALVLDEWQHEVRGNGPVILFIHGGIIAGTPESFLSQEALSEYQLVTYNRRGYSGSPPESGPADNYIPRHAADAAALLQELGIDEAHVVGHSSGGTIALQFAISYPHLVKSLVLLEAVVPVQEDPSNAQQREEMQAEALIQEGNFVADLDIFMENAAGLPEWRSQNTPAQVRQAEAYAPTFFTFEAAAFGYWAAPQG